MADVRLLRLVLQAATLSQHPNHIDDNDMLTEEEKGWIHHEVRDLTFFLRLSRNLTFCVAQRTHKWNHPFKLYLTIFVCCASPDLSLLAPCTHLVRLTAIGAATQGWDQTGSSEWDLVRPVLAQG